LLHYQMISVYMAKRQSLWDSLPLKEVPISPTDKFPNQQFLAQASCAYTAERSFPRENRCPYTCENDSGYRTRMLCVDIAICGAD
jgi:hypothetical protein